MSSQVRWVLASLQEDSYWLPSGFALRSQWVPADSLGYSASEVARHCAFRGLTHPVSVLSL